LFLRASEAARELEHAATRVQSNLIDKEVPWSERSPGMYSAEDRQVARQPARAELAAMGRIDHRVAASFAGSGKTRKDISASFRRLPGSGGSTFSL
jgi:hypothetical protein